MPHKHLDADTAELFTLEATNALADDLSEFYARVCDHAEKSIRKVVLANGAIQFRYQCHICGEKVGLAIKKTCAPADCLDEDVAFAERCRADRNRQLEEIYQKHIRLQKQSGAGYQQKYADYLRSAQWLARRAKVLMRAKVSARAAWISPPQKFTI